MEFIPSFENKKASKLLGFSVPWFQSFEASKIHKLHFIFYEIFLCHITKCPLHVLDTSRSHLTKFPLHVCWKTLFPYPRYKKSGGSSGIVGSLYPILFNFLDLLTLRCPVRPPAADRPPPPLCHGRCATAAAAAPYIKSYTLHAQSIDISWMTYGDCGPVGKAP